MALFCQIENLPRIKRYKRKQSRWKLCKFNVKGLSQTQNFPVMAERIICRDRAQALAAYPHAVKYNKTLYVSGISSRNLDNTYEGVVENADGTFFTDITLQSRAVIKKYDA